MLGIVRNAIDKFYIQKDYQGFKALCEKKLELFKELKDYIQSQKLDLKEGPDRLKPGRNWYIRFNNLKKNSFEISYATTLKISKIVPLFYIYHEFDIRNKDAKLMDPVLGYYREKPYSKKQVSLNDKICSVLTSKGYQRIFDNDFNEVIPGFNMPDGVTIFGPDVTPEYLLFTDVFRICERT